MYTSQIPCVHNTRILNTCEPRVIFFKCEIFDYKISIAMCLFFT